VVAGLVPGADFDTDEYGRNVELTEAGVDRVEGILGCGNLYVAENATLLAELHCALHARVLLRRDVDYIVRDGRVELVDERTGRVVKDRHWPDGLQAALEAKEGLERRPDGRILGTITLQHFLAGYERLCGMTGTAQAAARELHETYGRRVVVVPTHAPVVRVDHDDVVFARREAKERAVVEEVRRAHASGRPVLVGTSTVEESERLAARLRDDAVPAVVLNARHDAEEAAIVARAGAPGAVTISTNMAGRGTDIRLGGPDEALRDEVVARGGLYVVGLQRHESRRVDLQLRGRAGRQGDPGESRFLRPSRAPSCAARSPGPSGSSRGRTSRSGGRCGTTPRRSRTSGRRCTPAARPSSAASGSRTSGAARRGTPRWPRPSERTRSGMPSAR
jgi:preprotein translocase subunit SecA